MITSAKADTVVDAISAEAKEAADQCTGTRPALIALHLVDQINRSELHSLLKTSSGLHAITHAVFKGTNRLHVDSVAFTVPQVPRTDGHGAKWLSGGVVALYNPRPRFPCAKIRSIFRPAKGQGQSHSSPPPRERRTARAGVSRSDGVVVKWLARQNNRTMSAFPPIATEFMRRRELTRCARTGHSVAFPM